MTVVEMSAEMAQELNARDPEGVVVVKIDPESAAAANGIQKGDIIREVEQQAVKNLAEFRVARKRATESDGVLLLIERRGSTLYIVVNPSRPGRPQEGQP
jgi:serine protease Do